MLQDDESYKEQVQIDVGGTTFFAELADNNDVGPVGLDATFSFKDVRETVEAIAGELSKAWRVVQPDEAKLEFGLKLTAKSGKLTGLLVDGGGEATLTVALTWRAGNQSSAVGN